MSTKSRPFLRISIFLFPALLLLASGCKDKPAGPSAAGEVVFLKGEGKIRSPRGKVQGLKTGSKLFTGDTVTTGKGATAILSLASNQAKIELQPEAEFTIRSLNKKKRDLFLKKGDAWLKFEKAKQGEGSFTLSTPTSVAGVRGTKFYTFTMKDTKGNLLYGTCHCEGDVDYQFKKTGYSAHHAQDTVVLSNAEKTIILTPEESRSIGAQHNHSTLEASPLGPQQGMTAEQGQKMMALIEKKFKE